MEEKNAFNELIKMIKCFLKAPKETTKEIKKQWKEIKEEKEQPKIENTELEKAEVEKIIIDSGLFKADASNWISEIVLSNIDKGSKVVSLAIRKHGEPLSADEKRQHGIRANAIVSKQYFLSLTDEGKKDLIKAAFIVVQRILHKWSIRRQEASVLKYSIEMEIEFICAKDDRTCKAALELDGKRFPQGEAPDLPLPDCDAEYCRCLFLYHAKKRKL